VSPPQLSTIGQRWRALSPNNRAILLLLSSTFTGACMLALIKGMAVRYDSFQIAFFRSLFAFLVFLPIAAATRFDLMRTTYLWQHIWRTSIGVFGMCASYYAVARLPLALSTAISFAAPLFIVVLAVAVLGETVRWRRWLATAVGFLGVLVSVRPTEGISFAAIVCLLAALSTACSAVVTKRMPVSERFMTICLWSTLFSAIATLPPALAVWRMPDLRDFGYLALIGLFGAASQIGFVQAYRIGEVSAVGPVDYTRLVFATIIGFIWFAELPDAWTATGAALIVGSTAYIAHREAQLRKKARVAATQA
jgi:drug/metabolite transporter (DMT)-like permease